MVVYFKPGVALGSSRGMRVKRQNRGCPDPLRNGPLIPGWAARAEDCSALAGQPAANASLPCAGCLGVTKLCMPTQRPVGGHFRAWISL